MNNSIITTGQRSVAITHVCSCCGSPILRLCTIHSIAQVIYDFSRNKAQLHAEETVNAEIDKLISEVEGCKDDPHSLGLISMEINISAWNGVELRTINDKKTKSSTWITNLRGVCPVCGHQEGWQSPYAYDKTLNLKAENFPSVSDSFDLAKLKILLRLQEQKESIDAIRQNPEQLAQMREEYAKIQSERDTAQAALHNNELQDQITGLQAQKAKLEQDLKSAGVMAFKAKKEINSQIASTNIQLLDLQTKNKERTKELSKTVQQSELALKRMSPMFSSGDLKLEVVCTSEAMAFQCTY